MLENVQSLKGAITVKGGASGSVKNCSDLNSLNCSENVKLRLVNSKVKSTLDLNKCDGELIGSTISGKASVKESSINISHMSFEGETKLEDCITNINDTTAKKLEVKISNVIGSSVYVDTYNSTSSISFVQGLDLKSYANLSNSVLEVQSLGGNAYVDSTSSLVGMYCESSISSSGSVIATGSDLSVNVDGHGFAGVGCSGSSNFSGLHGGVDILAVPRINNRTSDDFVASAGGSVYMVAGSNLLCEASRSMNLVAKSKQLLKGSQVYVVGSSVPNFSPTDHCTSASCSKPVWKMGSTSQSVRLSD